MTSSVYSTQQTLTFDAFIQQLPDEEGRYELVDGEIVRIQATRKHDDIADYLIRQFDREVERTKLKDRISGRIAIKTINSRGREQGRNPDVTVVDRQVWEYNRSAYSALLEPPLLVVEVVSTNWEDDYLDKLEEYQRLGIEEYWIVDYLAIGSRNYLGNPKVPTVLVYQLDESGVYQVSTYPESDIIRSRHFPDLKVTVADVFNA